MTALQDVQDKIQGFEAGGVDFVSKPFQELEVLARVKTHLQLRRMQIHLEDLVSERTSELARAHAKIRESEERFRATFEQAAVGIAHVSSEGRFMRINQKFCDIVGYTHDEMLARRFQDITHPDDLETDLNNMQQLLAGELDTYVMEKRYFRKSGEIIWVHLTESLVRNDLGEPQWFVSVVKDITQRKKLQAERDRILNLTQDLICVAGMDGYFKYINPAWEKTLGYTQTELLARPFLDIIHSDDHNKNASEVESLATGNPTMDFENRYIHKNGSVRHISWVATPLVEEEIMYCIGRDITERKRSEQALQQYQQRLKALASQLIIAEEKERRRIAEDLHDNVGQSLALVRMQLAAARKSSSDPVLADKLDDVSRTLLETLQDTRHLIFDLSSPAMNEIGLGAAISEWLDAWSAKQPDLEAEFFDALDDRHRKLLDDSTRAVLFRNVRELATNAAKHARANKVRVFLRAREDRLQITVEDDGIGFNPVAVLADAKHRGFGLFSIRERMADLGGSLEIVSEPGQGCRVVMNLPVEGKKE